MFALRRRNIGSLMLCKFIRKERARGNLADRQQAELDRGREEREKISS